MYWFPPQMPAMAVAGPGKTSSLELNPGLPRGWQRLSLAASLGSYKKKLELGVEPGLKPSYCMVGDGCLNHEGK